MKIKSVMTAILLAAAATPALALEGDVYDCTFKTSKGELLSDRVVFVVDEKSSQAMVYDGVVHFVKGEPVKAKITENSKKKLKVGWSLMFPFRSGQQARVDFRVAFFKGNNTAVMSSQTMGATNQYNARGKCSKSKGKL